MRRDRPAPAASPARNTSRRTGSAALGHSPRNRLDQRRLPGAVHFRSERLARKLHPARRRCRVAQPTRGRSSRSCRAGASSASLSRRRRLRSPAYLRSQGIDVTATLRSPELLERIAPAKRSPYTALAAVRHRLRETLFGMLPNALEEGAVLRAMLLGERSFFGSPGVRKFPKDRRHSRFSCRRPAWPRGHFIRRREFLWTSQPATHRTS